MSLLIALVLAAFIQSPSTPDRATLTGQVLEDGTGAPVAGAQVNVVQDSHRASSRWNDGRPSSPVHDNHGSRGALSGRRSRAWTLSHQVQKAGFAMPLDGGAPPIDLGAGERRGIDIRLQRGAVIVGRVLDEAGEPLPDVRVMAMRKMAIGPARREDIPGGAASRRTECAVERSRRVQVVQPAAGRVLRAGRTATRLRRSRSVDTAHPNAAAHVLSFNVGPGRRRTHHRRSGANVRVAGHHDGRRAGISGVRRGRRRLR